MSEASIPRADDACAFLFTTTVGGYVLRLDEHRSVKLHLGRDQDGERRWALITENHGYKTRVGLSDEAMDAIVGIYAELIRDEEAASAIEAGTDETRSGSAEGESAPGRPSNLPPSRAGASPSPAASPNRSMAK